jgi:hypothetical protein
MLINLRIKEMESPMPTEIKTPVFHSIPEVPTMKVRESVAIVKIKNLRIKLIFGSSLKIL